MEELFKECEILIEKLEKARKEYDTYNEGLIDGIMLVLRKAEEE